MPSAFSRLPPTLHHQLSSRRLEAASRLDRQIKHSGAPMGRLTVAHRRAFGSGMLIHSSVACESLQVGRRAWRLPAGGTRAGWMRLKNGLAFTGISSPSRKRRRPPCPPATTVICGGTSRISLTTAARPRLFVALEGAKALRFSSPLQYQDPRKGSHNLMIDSIGRTVRLFLVEGKATGLVTAEVINWTGHVVAAPRSSLASLLTRDEARKTGVYLLVDDDIEQQFGQPSLYVGESDNVAGRIKTHDTQREFGRVCIITSKDANLTKSHILYLESRLIEIASKSGRVRLENARSSDNRNIPESDRADMEYFIQQLEIVLPVLGFDILRPTRRLPALSAISTQERSSSTLTLVLSPLKHPNLASAVEADGEITVIAGSRALTESYSVNQYAALRAQLIEDGRLKESVDPTYLQFTHDVPFRSPTAAAAVILNRNANGRTEWKVADGTGRSLKEYQDDQLEDVIVTDDVTQAIES